MVDADHTGEVTELELLECLCPDDEGEASTLLDMWRKMDTSQDGTISLDEWLNYWHTTHAEESQHDCQLGLMQLKQHLLMHLNDAPAVGSPRHKQKHRHSHGDGHGHSGDHHSTLQQAVDCSQQRQVQHSEANNARKNTCKGALPKRLQKLISDSFQLVELLDIEGTQNDHIDIESTAPKLKLIMTDKTYGRTMITLGNMDRLCSKRDGSVHFREWRCCRCLCLSSHS